MPLAFIRVAENFIQPKNVLSFRVRPTPTSKNQNQHSVYLVHGSLRDNHVISIEFVDNKTAWAWAEDFRELLNNTLSTPTVGGQNSQGSTLPGNELKVS